MKENRKRNKEKAVLAFSRHYAFYVMICLFAAILGAEFTGSLQLFSEHSWVEELLADEDTKQVESYGGVSVVDGGAYDALLEQYEKGAKQYQENVEQEEKNKILGHRNGVLASVVNGVFSGDLTIRLLKGVRSMTASSEISMLIVTLLSVLLTFVLWLFFTNVFQVVIRRLFLEGRTYERVGMSRFLFLIRVRGWGRASLTMFLTYLFHALWTLTIVGGVIKHYSYLMVKFIVAENPRISSTEAIRLSRQMMDGHKWEFFVNDCTFIGWFLLDVLTCGLLNLFFLNGYRTAYFSECYAMLREEARQKNIAGAEQLNDTYLFRQAEDELLRRTYANTDALVNEAPKLPQELTRGFRAFIAKWLGVSLYSKEVMDRYADYQAKTMTIEKYRAAYEKRSYPTLLSPVPEKEKNPRVANANYMRLYSLTTVILLFFTFCLIGWLWEVSLHIVEEGRFVNRGVLHGPWLPIYGGGGALILTVLYRVRKNPLIEFLSAVVLCGIVEYYTSWMLEKQHDGMKWWDYSGYFLNLNGRICAEGLLIFGLGGCAVVYGLAPILDQIYSKLSLKAAIAICAVLIISFTTDQIYSSKHPNMGEGVTDYAYVSAQVYSESGSGDESVGMDMGMKEVNQQG